MDDRPRATTSHSVSLDERKAARGLRQRASEWVRSRYFSDGLMALGLALLLTSGVAFWREYNPGEASVGTAAQQPTRFPTATFAPTETPTVTRAPSHTPSAPSPTAVDPPTRALTPTVAPTPTATRIRADAPPDRIVIPSINVDAPVVEVGWREMVRDGVKVVEWDVADYAAGFHRGSAYPGNVGNTVLSGHNNIKGMVFRYLSDLKVGEIVVLYEGKLVLPYKVVSNETIPEKYATDAERQDNAKRIGYYAEDRLTLVSCWPFTTNTHRVVVVAKPLY